MRLLWAFPPHPGPRKGRGARARRADAQRDGHVSPNLAAARRVAEQVRIRADRDGTSISHEMITTTKHAMRSKASTAAIALLLDIGHQSVPAVVPIDLDAL